MKSIQKIYQEEWLEKVALVRAFYKSSKSSLDEPFVSLDYPTANSLRNNFLELCKKFNSTVILVTHDLSEAIHLSNRILFLVKILQLLFLNMKIEIIKSLI